MASENGDVENVNRALSRTESGGFETFTVRLSAESPPAIEFAAAMLYSTYNMQLCMCTYIHIHTCVCMHAYIRIHSAAAA